MQEVEQIHYQVMVVEEQWAQVQVVPRLLQDPLMQVDQVDQEQVLQVLVHLMDSVLLVCNIFQVVVEVEHLTMLLVLKQREIMQEEESVVADQVL